MTAAPKPPFPGAHSQVTGRLLDDDPATPRAPASPGLLPLQASSIGGERGYVARLPVRAEDITVEKRTVVYERVAVERRELPDVERLDASVRREKLHVRRRSRGNDKGSLAG